MSLASKSSIRDLDTIDDLQLTGKPLLRGRQRRGGPRMPFVLLLIIAVLCGIGLAYVSQTAHVTEATYEAVSLAQQQQELQAQSDDLNAQLARLQSSSRVIAAATRLGMRPAGTWAYAGATPESVIPDSGTALLSQTRKSNLLQQFVAALVHAFIP